MRKVLFMVIFLSLLLILSLGSDVNFIINPYPPFTYLENGEKKGFSMDVLNAITNETGVDVSVNFMEWTEAFNKLKNDANTAMPSILMNNERKDMFKWVGPISIVKTSFYSKKDSGISITNLEDARKVSKICVVKDYYSEQLLSENNFENLLVFETQVDAFNAFINNNDYVLPANNFSFAYLLKENSLSISNFEELFNFSMDFMYIAFSKDTSDEKVNEWQSGLDKIKSNGKLQEIYEKWLPWESAPGKYVYLSEEYPPLTFSDKNGNPSGFVTDIVKEINKRIKNEEKIIITNWDLAYNAALINPNVVLFSMAKTEERKDKFNWIGPVIKNNAYFYKNSASNLALPSIDYAKKLNKIATTSGWWTEQRLKEMGFDNLISYQIPEECVNQLIDRNVDLSIFTDLTVEDIVTKSGHEMREIEEILLFDSVDVFIGISNGTSKKFIDKFIASYDSIIMDGTYSEIHLRYFSE